MKHKYDNIDIILKQKLKESKKLDSKIIIQKKKNKITLNMV